MENVVSERAESIKEDFPSGTSVTIQQGTKSFTGEWIGKDASTVFLGKVENYGCGEIGAFIVDVDGNIIGNGEDVDKLYPIRLDGDSWFVNLIDPTDTTIQKLMLTYNYDRTEQDSNLRMIVASETSVDVTGLTGLTDVNGVATLISTAGVTLTCDFDYGSQVTQIPFEGAVLADWAATEISPSPGAVALTSVTESSAGVYDWLFAAPATIGDVIELSLSKNGFEMVNVSITIV